MITKLWYVRNPAGKVFGPIDFESLKTWVMTLVLVVIRLLLLRVLLLLLAIRLFLVSM